VAWIESHQGLAKHPKTLKLARKLNISIAQTIGHLHLFWWWAMDYAQDGDLSHCDPEDIAIAADWQDDAKLFVDALIDVGFIDRGDDGSLSIHDWYEYAGKLIERRAADAARKKKSREKKDVRDVPYGCPPDIQRISEVNPAEVTRTSSVTVPKPKPIDDDDVNTHARDEKFARAYRTFEQHFGIVNPMQAQVLEEYIDAGLEPEMIEDAAVETRRRGFGVDYFLGILKNCADRGIMTRQAFREDQTRFEQKKASRARAGPVNRLQMANESLIRSIMEAEERDRSRSPEAVPAHPEHI